MSFYFPYVFVHFMSNLCPNYVQLMSNLCPTYVQPVSNLCPTGHLSLILPDVCRIDVQHMSNLCPTCVQLMLMCIIVRYLGTSRANCLFIRVQSIVLHGLGPAITSCGWSRTTWYNWRVNGFILRSDQVTKYYQCIWEASDPVPIPLGRAPAVYKAI